MKIGFIDYNLQNFHANKFLSLFRNELKHEEPEVVACYGIMEDSSKAWAEKNQVLWCPTVEAVVDRADALIILSPDNAEYHLPLAERTFAAAKPTFMDKTFANNYASAVAIADLATKHGTPLFSTSALRWAVEKEQFFAGWTGGAVIDVAAVGPGPLDRYGIHTLEPIVAIMGANLRRMRAAGGSRLTRLDLEWADGRTGHAAINAYGSGAMSQGWQVTVTSETAVGTFTISDPNFFLNTMRQVLQFFRTRQAPFDMAQTLALMAILDRAGESLRTDGWVAMS